MEATEWGCRGLRDGLSVAQARDNVIDRYGADGAATFVHYGQAVQIVFVEQLKYFLVPSIRQHGEPWFRFQRFHPFTCGCEQEASDGNGAGQLRIRVNQENGIKLFEIDVFFLDPGDYFFAGRLFANVNEIGIHHSARGIFLELEQLANFTGFFPGHFAEDVAGSFGRQAGQDVGGLVGVHFLEDVRGLLACAPVSGA